jgi:hypothetical protein
LFGIVNPFVDSVLGASFLRFMNNLKGSPSALWECGFREAVSKALWEVWVPQGGIHAFHDGVISTKPLF